MSATAISEWYTVKEAATLLRVSSWALYKHIQTGEVPHRRIGPKIILIPKTYVDSDNAQRQVSA